MVESATLAPGDDVLVAARVDERSRARRLVAPVATLVASTAALGYLAVVDPNEPGHYPLCPTRALFGVDCPGCGMMRATHDLITGDVRGALDHNILIVLLAPLAAVLWALWFRRAWRGTQAAVTAGQLRRRNRITIIALIAVIAFGVVRNVVPYLGSGLYPG